MIRKTMIAAALATLGLAGTALSQVDSPMTVANPKPVEMSPALILDARIDKLEKEIGVLKTRVQILCNAARKHEAAIKKIQQGPGGNESVTMQPPQSIAGSCL